MRKWQKTVLLVVLGSLLTGTVISLLLDERGKRLGYKVVVTNMDKTTILLYNFSETRSRSEDEYIRAIASGDTWSYTAFDGRGGTDEYVRYGWIFSYDGREGFQVTLTHEEIRQHSLHGVLPIVVDAGTVSVAGKPWPVFQRYLLIHSGG